MAISGFCCCCSSSSSFADALKLTDEFFDSKEPRLFFFLHMEELEKGAIAKPNEGRIRICILPQRELSHELANPYLHSQNFLSPLSIRRCCKVDMRGPSKPITRSIASPNPFVNLLLMLLLLLLILLFSLIDLDFIDDKRIRVKKLFSVQDFFRYAKTEGISMRIGGLRLRCLRILQLRAQIKRNLLIFFRITYIM
ncbi:uncharacterized protein LOC120271724 [Dioscorea cayenensis subsp. rotundata]|uniref:Uncharacterized protein LOC120271724 n=1 Tax=Dioscorea cayennensis subsp. rotundata TaxID=55577 RepID=A0AB40C643_DIOCR|nr:uncharacterized protein LOC120271724 [Dioscorea cayenensis subsp. rotundata]